MRSRRVVASALAALLWVGGCRSREERHGAVDRPGDAGGADDRARRRGQRMIELAAACASTGGEACTAACDLGHSNSCHAVGVLREPAADAATWHRRACDGGSGLGCEALGRLARDRAEADADALDRRARFYLRVHCEQRHAASCAALARLFATGRGGPVDAAVAGTFREQACALGAKDACGRDAPTAGPARDN